MDVSRLLLVAVASIGLGIPAAESQEDEGEAELAAHARGAPKPWKHVRGIGRVLDLSKLPVVIDEPGRYAIQRNWQIPQAATDVHRELVRITADDVTLDLHGFEISADVSGLAGFTTLLAITGRSTEIRNGILMACCEGAVAVAEQGTNGPWLHHMSIFSFQGTKFEGEGAKISDSVIGVRAPVQLATFSSLERNEIRCAFDCVVLSGEGNVVADNRMFPFHTGGVFIEGDGNVVANNVMDATSVAQLTVGFDVKGDRNVLRGNTILIGLGVGILWRISGRSNTLDGNIGAPRSEQQAGTGMQFTADGNYYGNNRVAARVPFALGGTVQTDWGGNVAY